MLLMWYLMKQLSQPHNFSRWLFMALSGPDFSRIDKKSETSNKNHTAITCVAQHRQPSRAPASLC